MKLNFDTIEELSTTNTVTVGDLINRVPLARLTYNARNGYIVGGYNIKSVTETAVGRYTVLFTRPLGNAELCMVGTYMDDFTTTGGSVYLGGVSSTATDVDFSILGFTLVELPRDTGTAAEPIRMYAVVYGTLADE